MPIESPVGIYRVTNADTIAASSKSLYIYDRHPKAPPLGSEHIYHSEASTRSEYPMCSTDGGTWKSMWEVASGPSTWVGNHGSGCGWILWHRGATYPGGKASCASDVHPCPVAGSHQKGDKEGDLVNFYACQALGMCSSYSSYSTIPTISQDMLLTAGNVPAAPLNNSFATTQRVWVAWGCGHGARRSLVVAGKGDSVRGGLVSSYQAGAERGGLGNPWRSGVAQHTRPGDQLFILHVCCFGDWHSVC